MGIIANLLLNEYFNSFIFVPFLKKTEKLALVEKEPYSLLLSFYRNILKNSISSYGFSRKKNTGARHLYFFGNLSFRFCKVDDMCFCYGLEVGSV